MYNRPFHRLINKYHHISFELTKIFIINGGNYDAFISLVRNKTRLKYNPLIKHIKI